MANNGQRWALDALRLNRDSIEVYHDNGRHLTHLAKEAGVKVTAVHVDLTTLTTTRYTITAEGKRVYGTTTKD